MNNLSKTCPLCESMVRFKFSRYERNFYACTSCELEFMYPQPTPEEISGLYDQSYYDSWGLDNSEAATERMKHATFHNKLDSIEAWMPGKGRILDIGCATGFFLDAARQRGWDPYGVELSDYSSEIARKKIGHDRIITGRVEDAAFDDAAFDAIIMTDVIEHVCDVNSFLREVTRILKPGGVVSITTPDPTSFSCRLLGKNWPHYKLEHLMYYSPKSLELLMKPLGYQQLHIASATKSLTLAYLELQLRTYPIPLITPIAQVFAKFLPASVLLSQIKLYSGELFLISRLGTECSP